MSEHTKDPWCVGDTTHENGEFIETAIMALEGRAAIAVCLDFGFNNLGMREANARRIVACVNACAGIDDPELWVAQMRFMDSDHSASLEIIEELIKQRDDLLAAAKMSLEMIETDAHERRHVRWKLKDAIENVESEK